MKIIKRKISIDSLISRNPSNYGSIIEPFLYINFTLDHDISDIGLFSNESFIERIISGVNKTDILKGYRPNYDIKSWHKEGGVITSLTESKLNEFQGYKESERLKLNFDINKSAITTFNGINVNVVSRITKIDGNNYSYVKDVPLNYINDENYFGEIGLWYEDKGGKTEVSFKSQGLNKTNSDLKALTKEEYLLSIISKPEIKSDIFIDRGSNNVLESHLRLREIETLDHLVNYNGGYYNITKQ